MSLIFDDLSTVTFTCVCCSFLNCYRICSLKMPLSSISKRATILSGQRITLNFSSLLFHRYYPILLWLMINKRMQRK